MNRSHHYVFVLWADRFDEAATAIFVTMLREVGMRVKVVGLTPQPINGAHGLILQPDFTLDEALALAPHTTCLIIPTTLAGLKRFQHDPRLAELLQQAQANQSRFVFASGDETNLDEGSFSAAEQVTIYPNIEDLQEFVQDLAGSFV
ncbi:MAG: DJ-1/PfpI family protein [Anaerolineae bacterium]|nr:DJ-1/PfpI family protein [Anaerolineae bacterium]